jgi:transketolase
MRIEFANICKELMISDPQTILLIGDISHHLLREAEAVDPSRFYNIGICEQAMISMASGLALEGYRPIVHTIAPFIVERGYEQIKINLGYQNTNVTLVSVGASFDYADLGCTHHCYGDISALRLIPNLEIYIPGNSSELRQLMNATISNTSPKYFRLSNQEHTQKLIVTPGEINLIRKAKNNKYVFVTGHLLDDVLENTEIGILYVSTLSHITNESKNVIEELFDTNTILYSIESQFKSGGLGDLISETFNQYVNRIGLDRKFLTNYGSYNDLREDAGISKEQILNKLL